MPSFPRSGSRLASAGFADSGFRGNEAKPRWRLGASRGITGQMEMGGETSRFEGGCACRAVRFRLLSAPMIVHACHCTECQRLTGAAFAVNALIETDRLETLAGEPRAVPVTGTSGKPQDIFRCPGCGTALWSHYPGAGTKLAFVRVGTLDEPAPLPPDIHIFTSTKLPWLALPPGARAVPEYYSSKQVWPAESLARRERLLGR